MRKILAIVVALLLSPPAVATKTYRTGVSELYKKSDLALFGTIQSGRVLPDDCGVEYVVRVDHPFKGKIHKGSLIRFRTNRVTQLGAEYFLFLSIAENEFSPVLSTTTTPELIEMRNKYVQRCQASWPPFVVNAFGNGALKTTGTYNSALPRVVLFDEFVVAVPSSLKAVKLGPHDRYDNDTDTTALDVRQFMSYMKALSSAK
jgi:hypothetical protein